MTKREVPSNLEWEHWGRTDPLYGVSSHKGRDKGNLNEWTDDEFYEFGKTNWEVLKRYWERYGVEYISCAEIGCGAGRYTMQLVDLFKKVFGLDVSDGMISYARERISNPNVEFLLTDGISIPLPDNSVTAVFSTHVFQHFNSNRIGWKNFSEAFRILTDGGTLLIHLPVYQFPARNLIFKISFLVWETLHGIYAFLSRKLIMVGVWTKYMRMINYNMDELFCVISKLGFQDIELLILPPRSKGKPIPLIFARKNISVDE
jgi:ubiquinone/menaquinone biosynthesis C-methylase UbiE